MTQIQIISVLSVLRCCAVPNARAELKRAAGWTQHAEKCKCLQNLNNISHVDDIIILDKVFKSVLIISKKINEVLNTWLIRRINERVFVGT